MKLIQTIVLSLLPIALMASCGNSTGVPATDNQSIQKAIAPEGVLTPSESASTTSMSTVSKGVADNIAAAKNSGKAVFLVVTGNGSPDTDKAMLIANGANNIYKNAVVVQMNRDDASNAPLVAEYRLASAPLPLILVISSKGIPYRRLPSGTGYS